MNQSVLRYHAFYGTTGGSKDELNIPTDMRSIAVDVEYETEYSFQIRIATEVGRSDLASMSWLSHAGIKNLKKKYNLQYVVKLCVLRTFLI